MMRTEQIRKAVVAFFGTLIALLAVLGVDEGGLRELFSEELIEKIATIVASAGTVAYVVWGVPNESQPDTSITLGDSSGIEIKNSNFTSDESGGVPVQALAALLLLIVVAACAQITPERAAAAVQCQRQADEAGLVVLSPERNAFMASCVSAIATGAVIENLILDDDALGGGGKL